MLYSLQDNMQPNGGKLNEATTSDYFMHCLTFGLKLLFSSCPPPGLMRGWPGEICTCTCMCTLLYTCTICTVQMRAIHFCTPRLLYCVQFYIIILLSCTPVHLYSTTELCPLLYKYSTVQLSSCHSSTSASWRRWSGEVVLVNFSNSKNTFSL